MAKKQKTEDAPDESSVQRKELKAKKLKKKLSVLKRELARSEKRLVKSTDQAERWKKEAKTQRKSAARAGARIEELQQQLDRALVEPTSADGVVVPDETWTVTQLRAEARARGLTGMSNKPKAELLVALR